MTHVAPADSDQLLADSNRCPCDTISPNSNVPSYGISNCNAESKGQKGRDLKIDIPHYSRNILRTLVR